ncbi:DUF2330 domain-containing protein [Streptomyces sp. NPDC002004]
MRGTRLGRWATTRALTVVLALLALQIGALMAPAYACGCGAMVPGQGTRMSVSGETSVVRWDGRREQIVMSLTVGGTAREAAWVMPVPHRATVKLGDSALFDELDKATAPEQRTRHYFWPKNGDWPFDGESDSSAADRPGMDGAGSPVGVVGRERLGPFDVARLTATDPDALSGWLHANGFQLPDTLNQALRPYVAEHWEYVAIRLAPADHSGTGSTTGATPAPTSSATPGATPTSSATPGATPAPTSSAVPGSTSGATPGSTAEPTPSATPSSTYGPVLGGTLDPLRIEFASDDLVYPMRLSRLAATPQHLSLYVLARHRMEPRSTIGGTPPRITYAGRVTGAHSPLAGLTSGTDFLTAFTQDFPEPARIDADDHLTRTAADTAYRQVVYEYELLTVGGVPAWLLTVGGVVAVALAATALALRAHARRPVVPPAPVQPPPPLG